MHATHCFPSLIDCNINRTVFQIVFIYKSHCDFKDRLVYDVTRNSLIFELCFRTYVEMYKIEIRKIYERLCKIDNIDCIRTYELRNCIRL